MWKLSRTDVEPTEAKRVSCRRVSALSSSKLLTSDTVFAGEEGNEGDVRANVAGTTGDEDPRLLRRHVVKLSKVNGGGREAKIEKTMKG